MAVWWRRAHCAYRNSFIAAPGASENRSAVMAASPLGGASAGKADCLLPGAAARFPIRNKTTAARAALMQSEKFL
jgi:hypothetical protein